ncbi:MAG: FHA domain-containing protein [Gammaproteobacteria bacterium]|nr:FHA domain-containing protein [Gammaproteobacteria bacterium]
MAENERNPGGPHGTVVLSPDELPRGAGGGRSGGSPDAPVLVGLTAPFAERRFRLPPERARIGRDPENDIVLDEPDVSLAHARIVRSGGQWRLVDLDSTNGTYLNGKRAEDDTLQFGDEVAFGPAGFVFVPGDMSPGATGAGRGRRNAWWLAAAGLIVAVVVIYLLLE